MRIFRNTRWWVAMSRLSTVSVAWRETPDGPEVLAVDEELEEFFAKTPPEQRRDVHFGQP